MCLYASLYRKWTLSVYHINKGKGSYIHIGVGSDVVCSTSIGNARASTRGTDNSDDSTSFCVLHRTSDEHEKVRYEYIE